MGLFSKIFDNEIKDTIPEQVPVDYSNDPFHMTVEDVFTVTGRGTVVTGRIDSGIIKVGEHVNISDRLTSEVLGIELFRKKLDYAQAGDNCGIYLKDISRDDIQPGDYLTK